MNNLFKITGVTAGKDYGNQKNIIKVMVIALFLLCLKAYSAPHWGQDHIFKQPDGSEVTLKLFGDEHYMRAETPDGYTVIRDESTGWISYAEVSVNGQRLVSTGVHYVPANNSSNTQTIQATSSTLGLEKHIRLSGDVIKGLREEKRMLYNPEEVMKALTAPILAEASSSEVTGNYKGLAILVDFSDEPAVWSEEVLIEMLNGDSFTTNGNNGSLKQYFSDISGGLLEYENVVFGYFRAPKTFAEYEAMDIATGAQEILGFVLEEIDKSGFDFSTLSIKDGRIQAINLMHTGKPQDWAEGMWHHASSYWGFSADGVSSGRYNTSPINNNLGIGVIAHENGHMIGGWPDTYKYNRDTGPDGIGAFDLMCNYGSSTNPVVPNPYFRWLAGWTTPIDISDSRAAFSRPANDNTIYKYTRPDNEREFFILEVVKRKGRRDRFPDEGLTIWHIDQDGNNQTTYHETFLEHANNNIETHYGATWHKGGTEWFDKNTAPNSRWRDGDDSGLQIYNISAAGSTMSFNVINTHNCAPCDVTAPTPVQNLKVTNTKKSKVYLKWDKATDNFWVAEYLVFQNGIYAFTVSGSQTNAVVKKLISGTQYTYTVMAKDAAGNISEAAPTVKAFTTLVLKASNAKLVGMGIKNATGSCISQSPKQTTYTAEKGQAKWGNTYVPMGDYNVTVHWASGMQTDRKFQLKFGKWPKYTWSNMIPTGSASWFATASGKINVAADGNKAIKLITKNGGVSICSVKLDPIY